MASARQKETIEYDQSFLDSWNAFCESACLKKRLVAHACRYAFMQLPIEQREQAMQEAMKYVVASRTRQAAKRRANGSKGAKA